jgi:hypothetical protein
VADGHYSLASRVLFILQAGYFKAKTLFFSFEIDEVVDDVKHVLQQHYPQYHDAALKSAIVPRSGRPGLQLSTGHRQPRARQRARPVDTPVGYLP